MSVEVSEKKSMVRLGFLQNRLTMQVRWNLWLNLVVHSTDWWGGWGEIYNQTYFFTEWIEGWWGEWGDIYDRTWFFTEQIDEVDKEKSTIGFGF